MLLNENEDLDNKNLIESGRVSVENETKLKMAFPVVDVWTSLYLFIGCTVLFVIVVSYYNRLGMCIVAVL